MDPDFIGVEVCAICGPSGVPGVCVPILNHPKRSNTSGSQVASDSTRFGSLIIISQQDTVGSFLFGHLHKKSAPAFGSAHRSVRADGKGQRPGGVVYSWVDSFLLPDPAVEFGTDLPAALRRAQQTGQRPVFIDFTGVRCTNCRYNENHVFTKPQVWSVLEQYERVQLYADEVSAGLYAVSQSEEDRAMGAEINRAFRTRQFGSEQLPLYVILVPEVNGKWAARVYAEGKINNVDGFIQFLRAWPQGPRIHRGARDTEITVKSRTVRARCFALSTIVRMW